MSHSSSSVSAGTAWNENTQLTAEVSDPPRVRPQRHLPQPHFPLHNFLIQPLCPLPLQNPRQGPNLVVPEDMQRELRLELAPGEVVQQQLELGPLGLDGVVRRDWRAQCAYRGVVVCVWLSESRVELEGWVRGRYGAVGVDVEGGEFDCVASSVSDVPLRSTCEYALRISCEICLIESEIRDGR